MTSIYAQPSSVHRGFERLLVSAAVDHKLGRSLLRDPRQTALTFGLAEDEADLLSDINAADLRGFAAILLPRLDTRRDERRRVAVG